MSDYIVNPIKKVLSVEIYLPKKGGHQLKKTPCIRFTNGSHITKSLNLPKGLINPLNGYSIVLPPHIFFRCKICKQYTETSRLYSVFKKTYFLCNLLRNLFHSKILYCCWFLLVNTKTGSVGKGKVLCPTNLCGKIEIHN